MTDAQLSALLIELLALHKESEGVEFKHDQANPERIAEYLSALANSAALHGRDVAYMVWGVEDSTHQDGRTNREREWRDPPSQRGYALAYEPAVSFINLRFIDTPPRSRNEVLANLMRRMAICEEGGSGIDKVVESIEVFQLPAPDFTTPLGFTKATLFGPKKLTEMDAEERIRACYQHCCLMFVSGKRMTNATLRGRLGVKQQNYAAVSRIIRETTDLGLVRPFDPSTSKRYMQYVPFWG